MQQYITHYQNKGYFVGKFWSYSMEFSLRFYHQILLKIPVPLSRLKFYLQKYYFQPNIWDQLTNLGNTVPITKEVPRTLPLPVVPSDAQFMLLSSLCHTDLTATKAGARQKRELHPNTLFWSGFHLCFRRMHSSHRPTKGKAEKES